MVNSEVNIGCQSRHICMCHLKFDILLEPEIDNVVIIDLFDFRQMFGTKPTRACACYDVSSEQRNRRGLFFASKVLNL